MLTRYSPARRPKRTWYLLTAARATRLALALSATLSAMRCACAPTVDVEVGPPRTGGWGLAASALLWDFSALNGWTALLIRAFCENDPASIRVKVGQSSPLLQLVCAVM